MKLIMTDTFDKVVISKACSIKADKDSTTSKTVSLQVSFEGVTLNDVFQKAMNSTVISWQNGQGRKNFDTWTTNQVVPISFKAPGRVQVDPIAATLAVFPGMDKAKQEALIIQLMEYAKSNVEPDEALELEEETILD